MLQAHLQEALEYLQLSEKTKSDANLKKAEEKLTKINHSFKQALED